MVMIDFSGKFRRDNFFEYQSSMRPVSSQDIVRFLQDKRNMGRETVIITGMTIFNVENLLFCNNNIIGH